MPMLENKICLITGCSRGIGRATASLFAQEGAAVYALARQPGSLDGLIAETEAYAGRLAPLYCDVTNASGRMEAIRRIQRENGRLDVLVNNAGIMKDANIGMARIADMEALFAVNVFAVTELINLCARLMIRKKSGSIVNVGSIVGERGNAGQIMYSASKGAIIALTKTAAHELGPHGIRVNAVSPGYIDTDMFRSIPEKAQIASLERVSLGRLGQPEDVARVCLFFASALSAYVSGQILGVNGDIL